MKRYICITLSIILLTAAFFLKVHHSLFTYYQNYTEKPSSLQPGKIINARNGSYYLPKNFSKDKKYALIVLLHPLTRTELWLIHDQHLTEKADQRNYILAAVRSKKLTDWNEENDISRIKAMIEFMKNNFPIDTNRVLLTGFSQGAYFTHLMLMHNEYYFSNELFFTAFAAGAGGSSFAFEKMMDSSTCNLPKIPGYIYWGELDPGTPGKTVAALLIKQKWPITTNPHKGRHWIPIGEYDRIFNWFDALIL